MKKIAFALCLTLLLATLFACNNNGHQVSVEDNPAAPSSASGILREAESDLDSNVNGKSNLEEITETVAKDLLERAIKEIIDLASEDPATLIKTILGDEIEVTNKKVNIDGVVYYETTAAFVKLYNYYSDIFTGDALNWILSTKFVDIDGTLYCSTIGGTTGWSIENLKVTRTRENSDIFEYCATFNEFNIATTCQFIIENTVNGYRISSIDYMPDLLKNAVTK